LNIRLLKKIKNELITKQLSLVDYDLRSDKKIIFMFLLKKDNQEDFKASISDILKDIEDVKNMIRVFMSYDGEHFENFNFPSYKRIDSLNIEEIIYNKIESYSPEIIDIIGSNYSFGELFGNTKEQTLEQFIYWYKKDKNLLN